MRPHFSREAGAEYKAVGPVSGGANDRQSDAFDPLPGAWIGKTNGGI